MASTPTPIAAATAPRGNGRDTGDLGAGADSSAEATGWGARRWPPLRPTVVASWRLATGYLRGVLVRFLVGERLPASPAQRARRVVVLDLVARSGARSAGEERLVAVQHPDHVQLGLDNVGDRAAGLLHTTGSVP